MSIKNLNSAPYGDRKEEYKSINGFLYKNVLRNILISVPIRTEYMYLLTTFKFNVLKAFNRDHFTLDFKYDETMPYKSHIQKEEIFT